MIVFYGVAPEKEDSPSTAEKNKTGIKKKRRRNSFHMVVTKMAPVEKNLGIIPGTEEDKNRVTLSDEKLAVHY